MVYPHCPTARPLQMPIKFAPTHNSLQAIFVGLCLGLFQCKHTIILFAINTLGAFTLTENGLQKMARIELHGVVHTAPRHQCLWVLYPRSQCVGVNEPQRKCELYQRNALNPLSANSDVRCEWASSQQAVLFT